jgi:hypothetical protein
METHGVEWYNFHTKSYRYTICLEVVSLPFQYHSRQNIMHFVFRKMVMAIDLWKYSIYLTCAQNDITKMDATSGFSILPLFYPSQKFSILCFLIKICCSYNILYLCSTLRKTNKYTQG